MFMDNNNEFIIKVNDYITIAAYRFEKLISLGLPPVLVVVDDNLQLKGTITDGDIRRFIIKNRVIDGFVDLAMNTNCLRISDRSETKKSVIDDYKVIPIVNYKNEVIDIVYSDSNVMKIYKSLTVVINAGGLGTRLVPYTSIYPKPLVPVNHIPMIDHVIGYFRKYDVSDIKIILNHKQEMFVKKLD